jgi:hypothetical protein
VTIKIDLVGRYGEDGWEDPETGENFYNDRQWPGNRRRSSCGHYRKQATGRVG